jgi:anaerobic magnesium-protoporphyrin IX monomethyl ester cyclase
VDKLAVVPFSMEDKGIRIKDTSWSKDLLAHVEKYKPDLIGLSTTEDMYELGLLFLETIKDYKIKNNVPVIAGGVFPTFAPEIVIKEKLIDLVCVGEGENALIQLCKKIEDKQHYNDITNCWVKTLGPEYLKDRNVIQKNPISKPVDINTNPMIDISLFEENRLYRPMGGKVYKMFPVETIRGCPYTCKFCNSPTQMDLYKDQADGGYFRKKKN